MATIKKRTWTTKAGEDRTAWQLHYVDIDGNQRRKQFDLKSQAEDERVRVEGEIAAGIYVSDRQQATVLDVAKAFLQHFQKLVDANKRERTSYNQYRQHIDLHISKSFIGKVKLHRLGGPDCNRFAEELETNKSDAMAKKIFASFKHIVGYGKKHGLIKSNPAEGISITTRRYSADDDEVQIPPKEHIEDLVNAATQMEDNGQAEAMIAALLFGGIRVSELRGLKRDLIDNRNNCLRIRQRADKYNEIGPCKSKAGRRTVPMPPHAMLSIKRWLMAAPKSQYAFPNGIGNVESYANIYNRIWAPLMKRAGLADIITDTDPDSGEITEKIKPWFGMHALRHAAVSIWIELNVPAKKIQAWAGHSSITVTMDTYGHLWPDLVSDQDLVKGFMAAIRNYPKDDK